MTELVKEGLIAQFSECLPVNFFAIDRNGFYLYKNPSLEKIVGPVEIASAVDEKAWQSCLKVIQTGLSEVIEEEYEGKIYWSHKVPLRSLADEIVGVLGISLDITDRKLAEINEKNALAEAVAANIRAQAETETRQAVMITAGSIGHDLRTPLATLALHNSIFKESLPYLIEAAQKAEEAGLAERPFEITTFIPKLEELVMRNDECLQRTQNDITDSLKMLKQVVLGDISIADLSRCELYHFFHGIEVRYPFEKGQRALLHLDGSYNFAFTANEALFFRILCNLLRNSFQQIAKTGRGEIFMSAHEGEKHNYLLFKDTGGGAPPEVVAHIFAGYKTTKQEGTGVGLAFCKLAMERFGGTITCQSVEGDYIEFMLLFPKLELS